MGSRYTIRFVLLFFVAEQYDCMKWASARAFLRNATRHGCILAAAGGGGKGERGKKRRKVVFCTSIVWQRQHCDSGLGQVGARFDISSAFLSSFGAFRCLKLFSMSANGSITRIGSTLLARLCFFSYFGKGRRILELFVTALLRSIHCACALLLLVLLLCGLRRKEPITLG